MPMIVLSQRPAWISRFVFSESDFYQIFKLVDIRDWKTVMNFIPVNPRKELPLYHSWYYDVVHEKLVMLAPVPAEEDILGAIDEKLRAKRTFI